MEISLFKHTIESELQAKQIYSMFLLVYLTERQREKEFENIAITFQSIYLSPPTKLSSFNECQYRHLIQMKLKMLNLLNVYIDSNEKKN